MMTCRELCELLLDFVADDLTAEVRVQCEEHLRVCPCCEAYVQTYRLTIHLTRRLPCSTLPEPLRKRCEELLRQEGADDCGQRSA